MKRHVFIGWDPRDDLAWTVAERSLRDRTDSTIYVHKLIDRELRKKGVFHRPYRVDEKGQMWDERDTRPFSTEFSFTRFAVPLLCQMMGDDIDGPVLFLDADVMFRGDVAQLFDLWNPDKSVMCVQHNQVVTEQTKMGGLRQSPNTHGRKNWSSVMLMEPDRCIGPGKLTRYAVNNMAGSWLHSMCWMPEEEIGALPEEWNYLVGHSNPDVIKDPKLVHYTLGTPDMVETSEFTGEWWDYAHDRRRQLAAVGA